MLLLKKMVWFKPSHCWSWKTLCHGNGNVSLSRHDIKTMKYTKQQTRDIALCMVARVIINMQRHIPSPKSFTSFNKKYIMFTFFFYCQQIVTNLFIYLFTKILLPLQDQVLLGQFTIWASGCI